MAEVVKVVVSAARGPRGRASGPLGAESVGPDHLTGDALERAEMAYRLGLGGSYDPLIPTVCITFDYWTDAYEKAFGPMSQRGLVGTWFVDYRTIDNFAETLPDSAYNLATKLPNGDFVGGVRSGFLLDMKQNGWTIGAYLGGYPVDTNGDGKIDVEWNMRTLYSESRELAVAYFKAIVDKFHAKGLDVASVAPNQRAWDRRLANVTRNLWRNVRVCSQSMPQPLPITDPLYIDKGSPASLDNGDTPASINAVISEFLGRAKPGLLTFVIHKIGDPPANLSVPPATFTALLDRLMAEQNAGRLKVVGYDDLR